MTFSRKRWAPALVFLVTALVFFPGLANDFVNWDDRIIITRNPYFRGLGWEQIRWAFAHYQTGKYMPLAWLSYELDYALWGLNPVGYHFTSLLIHAANAALFYLLAFALLERIGRDERAHAPAAAFAALFYALHPLRVESVTWAAERADVLSGLFYLAALLLYVRGKLWPSLASFALSLLAKATGVTLPLVLLLLDVYPLGRVKRRRDLQGLLVEKWAFFAGAAVFGLVGISGQGTTKALVPLWRFGLLERLAQSAYAPAFYLAKTLLPIGLSPLYSLSPRLTPLPFVLAAAFDVLATLLLAVQARERPWAIALWLFFLLALAPVAGFVKLGLAVAADRYSYLAALGPALAAGILSLPLLRRRLGAAVLAGALLLLSAATVAQIGTWKDSITFWSHAIAVDPGCYVCRKNLGDALTELGRADEGRGQLARSQFLLAQARHEMGMKDFRDGRFEDAARRFSEALEAYPDSAATENDLGLCLDRLGRSQDALPHFERAAALAPGLAEARLDWGLALARLGRLKEARAQYVKALSIQPENLPAAVALQLLDSGAVPSKKN